MPSCSVLLTPVACSGEAVCLVTCGKHILLLYRYDKLNFLSWSMKDLHLRVSQAAVLEIASCLSCFPDTAAESHISIFLMLVTTQILYWCSLPFSDWNNLFNIIHCSSTKLVRKTWCDIQCWQEVVSANLRAGLSEPPFARDSEILTYSTICFVLVVLRLSLI